MRSVLLALAKTASVIFVSVIISAATANAEQLIRLRNGLVLRGFIIEIPSLDQNPFAVGSAGEIQSRPIWMVDDGLRRVYIHKIGMVADPPVDVGDLQQTITLPQSVPLGGKEVQGLGALLAVSSFNDYGRREVWVNGPDGMPLPIFQGITEINARYAKLASLKSTPSYLWDMRLATSTLDSTTLNSIFKRCLDMNDLDARYEVVRFFIETERFADAKEVVKETVRMFPDEKRLEAQIASITERQANQLLKEAEVRSKAGQPELARKILQGFPLSEVGRLTRIQVQDLLDKDQGMRSQISDLLQSFRNQVEELDVAQKKAIAPLIEELANELSVGSLPRLSDYSRLRQAPEVAVDSRVALAICGWLLGSGSGEQNLPIAISLLKVRELVSEYLSTEDAARRATILTQLADLEGAQPEYVSRILKFISPPLDFPEGSADERVPGMYRVGGEGVSDDVQYTIQLPPEYDEQQSYPCIVALAPPEANPESQIEWWSGKYDEAMTSRLGLGSRHGFIVVAPSWVRQGQSLYEYTPREHAKVLASLRDAMRRSQIDSDRVFLCGHGEGGTAAWDIALAHPDLWAGMVSVGGEPRKTVLHYADNAKYVPLYLLMGEKDGAPAPLIRSGPTMDDYMKNGYDAMVVMYRGRGREYFYEDMPNIFDWFLVPTHVRTAPPKEIETATMRSGDRFFWWLEMASIKDAVAINPILWEQAERLRAGKVSASIGADNQIRIGQGPADAFTVWLSPEIGLDMNKKISVRYHTRQSTLDYQGDLSVMLEDARTRADRKHAFWARVSIP